WERFLHASEEIDPLVRMAAAHYQFEAIHPFSDGNGRTGRVLNLLFLIEQKLLDSPVLYLSRAIIRRKADYYRLLRAVTVDGRWEEWILFMLAAVEETARWTTDRIRAIRELLNDTAKRVAAEAPAVYSRELIELLFVQPYCRIANVVEAGIAQRQTASVYLKALAEAGVLREVKVGREKLFVNPRLMALLTEEREARAAKKGRRPRFPFFGQERHEPGIDEELLAPDLDLAQDAGLGQRLEIDRSGLALSDPGLDDIRDAAVRLHEQQLDQLAAVDRGRLRGDPLRRVVQQLAYGANAVGG